MTPSSGLAQIKNGDIRLLGISSGNATNIFRTCRLLRSKAITWSTRSGAALWSRPGRRRTIVDSLILAIQKMKQTKEWQDFLAPKHAIISVSISLDGMQK